MMKRRRLEDRVISPLAVDTTDAVRCGRGLVIDSNSIIPPVIAGTVLATAIASAIGLTPDARKELCSCCLLSSQAQLSESLFLVCAECNEATFCADCTASGARSWHGTSGECQAFSAMGRTMTAEGALVIRSLCGQVRGGRTTEATVAATGSIPTLSIGHRDCDDDADCFDDLTPASIEDVAPELRDRLQASVEVLLPVADILRLPRASIELGLAKLACNAHDFGQGRAIWPRIELFNHSCAPSAYMVVSPVHGLGLRATVRALRPLNPGENATISYQQLDGLTSTQRRQALRRSSGWECCCEACCGRLHDALLAARGSDATDADVEALGGGLEEAEAALAAGDAETALHLCALFARGARGLGLGPYHALAARIRALQRDASWALGDVAAAAEHSAAWLRAVEPVAALVDPAARCHGLTTHALALLECARGRGGAIATRKRTADARAALSDALALASATLGEGDVITSRLVLANAEFMAS